jgi:aminoglycoside 3-N-acetyltransferase
MAGKKACPTKATVPDFRSADILSALRFLGLRPGDLLVVHSSLSSFGGNVGGGADAVVDALLASVSPGGSAFVPTFNYGQLPFDAATTPSLAGAITEAFRRRAEALRSRQPTHPWAGIGPAAREVLEGHEQATPFGRGSPIWRLWERDARVLLLGVDHRANSMIHVAEESLDLPYLRQTRVAKLLRADGSVADVTVRRPGHSGGFNKVDAPLRAAGTIRETTIGKAKLTLIGGHDLVATAQGMLRKSPASLLCDNADCERCAQARVMLARI